MIGDVADNAWGVVESSECDDGKGVETVDTFTVISKFGEGTEFDEFTVVLLLVVVVAVAIGF